MNLKEGCVSGVKITESLVCVEDENYMGNRCHYCSETQRRWQEVQV